MGAIVSLVTVGGLLTVSQSVISLAFVLLLALSAVCEWPTLFYNILLSFARCRPPRHGPGSAFLTHSYLQFAISIFSGVQRHVSGLRSDERSFVDPATKQRVPFLPPFATPSTAKDDVYLSVVFPAYNEAERMPITIEETVAYLKQRGKKEPTFTWEIVIVDDGSRDRTFEVGAVAASWPRSCQKLLSFPVLVGDGVLKTRRISSSSCSKADPKPRQGRRRKMRML